MDGSRLTKKELIEENKLLREKCALLEKTVGHLEGKVTYLEQKIELQQQKIDLLVRKIYGSSSEKIDLDQLLLFEKAQLDQTVKKPEGDDSSSLLTEEPSPQPKPRKKRQSCEATLPANIATEEITLLPDEVKEQPENYRQVGEETTTKLDYTPAQFKKIITRRLKFVKRLTTLGDPAADSFHIAPLPASIKEKSLLTPRLAAEIATNRYCDHQPYYRQEQHFLMRHGVHLPRNTMSQWMADLAHDYLLGIYNSMHADMLATSYLQADETPIDYQSPGSGSTQTGYLWTVSKPDLSNKDGRGDILYQWHTSRATACLTSLLQTSEKTFCGILQCDGYQAYESYRKHTDSIELIACWAHVRRKVYEARNHKPKLSGWLLHQIRNLYRIEARLREQRAGPAQRERVRLHESIPIYRRLEKALHMMEQQRKALPQSPLGKAISYALGQWNKLEKCFLDGRLEIDNNLIENGIRPTKLGAKNWLFMGSAAAGQNNAIWYTLIESCRRRQLDPWKYLVWILEALPQEKVKADTFARYTPSAYAGKIANEQRAQKIA